MKRYKRRKGNVELKMRRKRERRFLALRSMVYTLIVFFCVNTFLICSVAVVSRSRETMSGRGQRYEFYISVDDRSVTIALFDKKFTITG